MVQKSVLVLAALTLCQCSTFTKSSLAGGAIGGGAGAVAGSFLPGNQPQNIVIGALAGGTIGALSGALIHKNMEDKERESFDKGKVAGAKDYKGSLSSSGTGSGNKHYVAPKVERHWMDDEIRGNVLIEGHYEQVIVEEGHWE